MKTQIFALMLSALTFVACAQTKSFKLSGVVTDAADKSPLSGVSVNIKGTTTNTNTDARGHYRLKTKTGDRLVFSFVGYESYETKIGKDSSLNVSLQPDSRVLSEVVATGYEKAETEAIPTMSLGKDVSSKAKRASAPVVAMPSVAIEKKSALMAADELGHSVESLKPNEKPQARILTAAEWNDIAHWDFWQNLMHENQLAAMQSHWSIFTNQKMQIVVKDKKGKPANDVLVELWTNNKLEWIAHTDIFGEAVLWNNLFETPKNEQLTMVVKIKNADGQELKSMAVQDKNVVQEIVLDTKIPVPNVTDIMFVVDATGSMGDEISYLKSELEDIVGRVQSSDNQEVIRLGMTFYRDHGDEYLVRNFDFKTDIKQIQSDLNQQSAGGGGDFEEAVDEALDQAINQQRWSATATTRLLFLILDAPPHHDLQHIKTMQKNIETAAQKGIKIIPVVASGIDKNTEFLMRMTAQATNGTYVFITDDSGVGNSHLKPTIGSYQVEYLNNLMLRLIKKYSSSKNDL
jgi:CarboxypepD_reg-like domain/von Willebrand factor type A domain